MGKKSRRRVKPDKPVRRPFVARSFEGLPSEGDWVALREVVPAATATVAMADGSDVRVCSLLPGGTAGLVRPDGTLWLGLQVLHNSGDVSRDLGAVVERARETEPGHEVPAGEDPGDGPRLQDLLADDATFDVTVHEGFDYWVDDDVDPGGELGEALEAANQAAAPTLRLDSVEAAYWTRMGDRVYLRWVQPHPEDRVLDALARLHAAGSSSLVEGSRLIGMFRAHGLLVPVWELEADVSAADVEDPAAAFGKLLAPMLDEQVRLSAEERSARAGLAHRQLTIR